VIELVFFFIGGIIGVMIGVLFGYYLGIYDEYKDHVIEKYFKMNGGIV